MSQKTAISPTREEDFPEWYQQVIKAAEMAENAPVRGCMVMKPWGFAIWELIQAQLDSMIKSHDVENVYFPLFIPLSYFQKEAQHIEGFAKECAVVTHHRLEEKEGSLVPAGPLQEPLVVRPTSEMIIGESLSRWIDSYRDLPFKINQWANIVRWEMRPRLFLRTAEFLWQEGHTAHATLEEAQEQTKMMLEMYVTLHRDVLAIPVIPGEKSESERFPGALSTLTLESMMQDRKALQSCTSHNLRQNFSKAQSIVFNSPDGSQEYAWTTSWGCTTRTIGSLIMVHADDDGLRLPPRVAPKQVVILPITPKEESKGAVLEACRRLQQQLTALGVRASIDDRDRRGGEKSWEWIKKGVPMRVEIGPKDLEKGTAAVYQRHLPHKERQAIALQDVAEQVPQMLEEIHNVYYLQAEKHLNSHLNKDLKTFEELKAFFSPKNAQKPEIHGGFAYVPWSQDRESEELLKPLGLSVRCLPLEQEKPIAPCILTGKPATTYAVIAKAY